MSEAVILPNISFCVVQKEFFDEQSLQGENNPENSLKTCTPMNRTHFSLFSVQHKKEKKY